jgi:glycosyltransferase involved in cell wall biosynthesis
MARAMVRANASALVDIASTDYGLTPEWHQSLTSRLPRGSRLHVLPESRWLGDEGASLQLLRWLWNNVASYDVVHIHALFHRTSSAAARIARIRGVPYVVRPLGTLSPYTFTHRRQLLKKIYFSLVERRTIEHAAAVHFTAPQEMTKAARLGLRTPAFVIPNPFEAQSPALARPEDTSMEVLFMSRLHPVKGLQLLLRAFAGLALKHPASRLVIAGTGAPGYVNQLKQEAGELGIDDRVTWAGWVQGEQQRNLLRKAAVFVQPSYQENFGVSVVEALGAGVPVVVTREVDIWPDIERYGSGLVCDVSAESLEQAIDELLSDDVKRSACALGGPRQVEELYAPDVVGAALDDMYRSAVGAS